MVEVTRASTASTLALFTHYYYDPSGNRVGRAERLGGGATNYTYTWYVRDAQGNVMATYSAVGANASAGTLTLSEHHIYGSDRIGIIRYNNFSVDRTERAVTHTEANLGITYLYTFTRGNKLFEVTNHLGNVVATVSDRKEAIAGSGGSISGYRATLTSITDYSPFGMLLPGRYSSTAIYRYGFNGKEYNARLWSTGNEYDYGFRIYDPKVGRFLSVDPITKNYPMLTPYQYASNRPIDGIDLDGLEWFKKDNTSYRIEYQTVSNANSILDGANRTSHNILAFVWNGTLGAVLEAGKGANNYLAGGYKERTITPMEALEDVSRYHAETPFKQQLRDYKEAATDLRTYEGAAQFLVGTRLFGMTFKPKISLGSTEAFEYLYRVQGGSSKLRFIWDDAKGSLGISGDDMLFANIGQEGRAMEFLAKRGDEAVILKIKVHQSFTDKLRKDAVPQNTGRQHPGKPQIVDATKAPDQFGIPKEYFDELLNSIDQNSIEIITKPKE